MKVQDEVSQDWGSWKYLSKASTEMTAQKGNRARAGGAQYSGRQYLIGAETGSVMPSTPYFSEEHPLLSQSHTSLSSVGLVTNLVPLVPFGLFKVFESVLVFIVILSHSEYPRCSSDLKLPSHLMPSNAEPWTTELSRPDLRYSVYPLSLKKHLAYHSRSR